MRTTPPDLGANPKLTEECFILLEQAVLDGPNGDLEALNEVLNDIYTLESNNDPELEMVLLRLRDSGKLYLRDVLYLFVLFRLGESFGKEELNKLRDSLVSGEEITSDSFAAIAQANFPEPIKEYLRIVLGRVFGVK